jgi:N-acetyl-gamma-glutamyl-phosphate reductase
LIHAHPRLELAFVTSDQLSGKPARDRLGIDTPLSFSPNESAATLGADAVLLCTPAEASAKLAPAMIGASGSEKMKLRTIDFSGAFRLLDRSAYAKFYKFEHPHPELLETAHYGLPELFGAPPETAKLVANPGCYPTATLLALLPLLRSGLVEREGIVIDAKSGVTGAGRQAREEYSFAQIDGDLRAYRVLAHQHTPEITRGLGVPVTFVPHLLPVARGLLATCYARPAKDATPARLEACLRDAYANRPFVRVCSPEEVSLRAVVGTNLALVGVAMNEDAVVAFGAIDNLLKGAAGQALQNLNLWMGFSETEGLPFSPFAA